MKRVLTGLAVLVLGVSGVRYFGGGEDPVERSEARTLEGAEPVAQRETSPGAHPLARDREADPPMRPRVGPGEPTPEQIAAAPFVTFSSRAAPRWQGVSRELRRLGHEDLADETWSMAAWVRARRADTERDDATVVEAQQDLLERVLAVPDLDPPAADAVAAIKDTIQVYDSAWRALPEG